MLVKKFRKKPDVVEAFKIGFPEDEQELPDWLNEAITGGTVYWNGACYHIETIAGDMIANPGDWIAVHGNCICAYTPDEFSELYEEVA